MTPTNRIIKALRERVRECERCASASVKCGRIGNALTWNINADEAGRALSTAIAIRDEGKARKHG
jgi:hypothetical protein